MPGKQELIEFTRTILETGLRRTQPLVYAYIVAAAHAQLSGAFSRREFAKIIGEPPSQVTEALQIAEAFPVCELLRESIDPTMAAALPHSVLRALVTRVSSAERLSALRHIAEEVKKGTAPTVALRTYLERNTPPPPPFILDIADDGTMTLKVTTPLDQMSSADMLSLEAELEVRLEPWRNDIRRRLGLRSLREELIAVVKNELGSWGGYLAVQIKELAPSGTQSPIHQSISLLQKEMGVLKSMLYDQFNDTRVIKDHLMSTLERHQDRLSASSLEFDVDIRDWLENLLERHFERVRAELLAAVTQKKRPTPSRRRRPPQKKKGVIGRFINALRR